MWLLLALTFLALLSVPFVVSLRRATELFVIRVSEGAPRLVRGRLPGRLFADVADVLRRAGVRTARVRVVVEGGVPRVIAEGLGSAGVAQQLRNVVGAYRIAELRNGKMRPKRNV